uniref:Uncharacterized protein n=1 Tax=Rhizophora mucronata TaxID=61149 RepID=A0A2P2QGZ5_RHIMU
MTSDKLQRALRGVLIHTCSSKLFLIGNTTAFII